MKTLLKSLIVCALISLLIQSCDKSNQTIPPEELTEPIKIELRGAEEEIVKSDALFAFDLFNRVYREEMKENKQNFMLSPFSLSMALAMTWNGADGDTKSEMQQTLKMGDYSDEEINGYYSKMKENLLKTDASTKLSIANSIWTNKNIPIEQDFLDVNKKYYQSEVQSVDFGDANTVKRINQWAADNTNDLIKKVILQTKGSDLMYLLNAIYFKGIWTSQFKKENTTKMPFTTYLGSQKNVDMMFQHASFNYTADETVQILELPYGNQAFNMTVLLPQKGVSPGEVIDKLIEQNYYSNLKSRMRSCDVDVFLPKFKTEYKIKLNGILSAMGMPNAFISGKANFSRMTKAVDAYIGFVKQKTYIQTDEVGTEAAAVTVVGMEVTAINPSKNVTFKADRPFMYIIQEKSTGAILFMGIVHDFE